MDSFESQYIKALVQIQQQGHLRSNRTETDAYSLFDIGFKFDVSRRYPILTGKYISQRIVDAEFEWLITGQTNTSLFKDRGISIWDQWADPDTGELGPVYGYQLVNFNGDPACNQLKAVIQSISEDPYGRRHIISLWNPQQLKEMALPPCYLYFQFYVDNANRVNMFVVQRSGDMFVGVPYDVCLFTNLLVYISNRTNFTPGIISHRIVDAHVYKDHLDGIATYLSREYYTPPVYTVDLFGNILLYDYLCHPQIKIPIAK